MVDLRVFDNSALSNLAHKSHSLSASSYRTNKAFMVAEDVARGREGVAIPAVNEIDDEPVGR